MTSKWAKRVATDLHGSAALLGTVWAIFELVWQNASAACTTSYGYNDAGEQISQTSPAGMRAGSRPGMRMADPGRCGGPGGDRMAGPDRARRRDRH